LQKYITVSHSHLNYSCATNFADCEKHACATSTRSHDRTHIW